MDDVPRTLEARELFPVPLVLAMRPDHPLARRARGTHLTVGDVAAYQHAVVVFAGPPRTRLDHALEASGATRHPAVVLNSFLAVPYLLAVSDAVAVLPGPYARRLEALGRVAFAPVPDALSAPPLRMRLIWPRRLGASRAWVWLRDLASAVAEEQTR
jgi:DNA-binding transcriptional LysR family regulator